MKKMWRGYSTKLDINKLSNYLINIGIALSILNLILIYNARSGLPEGVCPIYENNDFIILSIGISIIGLILSFFSRDKEK